MSKKQKTVLGTKPKVFRTPYRSLKYFLIQHRDQLKNMSPEMASVITEKLPNEENHTHLASTWLTYVPGEGSVSVIYYPELLEDDEHRALVTLCHECVHVWQAFSRDMLSEHNPSDEFEAYTIDEIFGNALDEYRRLKKIHKKEKDCSAISPVKTAA